MNAIIESLTHYYGLDWISMIVGLTSMYMITRGIRFGFFLNALACIGGLTVAAMSAQLGYVFYNAIIMCMVARTFITWPQTQATKA